MTETSIPSPSPESTGERYLPGYEAAEQHRMSRRTAQQAAAFLLPHLRSGMALLDCGCGPGSIAIDLAELVAPGMVVGLDIEMRQIEFAREQAARRGVDNIRFEQGSVYKLPFPDGAFDVVWSHAVLKHLSDPLAILKEFRRVLRSDGMVAISDLDWGSLLWEPSTPELSEVRDLLLRVWEHNGSSPYYARHQRRLLREAGFARTEAWAGSTYPSYAGRSDSTRHWAGVLTRWFEEPAFVTTAHKQLAVDDFQLAAMKETIRAWGESPDAFFVVLPCSAMGWVRASSE
ncbi:MAG: methyltransferase domain-containing protein [Ardenticatenales bacterium]|nr:methyltransferase domain-containing protein [Ardenticatenales bacterium]